MKKESSKNIKIIIGWDHVKHCEGNYKKNWSIRKSSLNKENGKVDQRYTFSTHQWLKRVNLFFKIVLELEPCL